MRWLYSEHGITSFAACKKYRMLLPAGGRMWQLPIPSCHIYQLAQMAAYDHKADVYYDNNNDTNYETCLFGGQVSRVGRMAQRTKKGVSINTWHGKMSHFWVWRRVNISLTLSQAVRSLWRLIWNHCHYHYYTLSWTEQLAEQISNFVSYENRLDACSWSLHSDHLGWRCRCSSCTCLLLLAVGMRLLCISFLLAVDKVKSKE